MSDQKPLAPPHAIHRSLFADATVPELDVSIDRRCRRTCVLSLLGVIALIALALLF